MIRYIIVGVLVVTAVLSCSKQTTQERLTSQEQSSITKEIINNQTDKLLPPTTPSLKSETNLSHPILEEQITNSQVSIDHSYQYVAWVSNIINKFAAFNSFSTDIQFHADLAEGDQNVSVDQKYHLSFQRPNKILLRIVETNEPPTGGVIIACNGTNVLTYFPAPNRYDLSPAPAEINGIPGPAAQFLMQSNPLFTIIDGLLKKEPATHFLPKENFEIQFLQPQQIDGVLCEGIKFIQTNVIWDAWISKEKALLYQIDIDLAPTLKRLAEELEKENRPEAVLAKTMSRKFTIRFINPRSEISIPSSTFYYEFPQTAQPIQ